MGLDMYAMITNNTPESPVDFKAEDATELHYWRKHPNTRLDGITLLRQRGSS